jgi:hypothetical protein
MFTIESYNNYCNDLNTYGEIKMDSQLESLQRITREIHTFYSDFKKLNPNFEEVAKTLIDMESLKRQEYNNKLKQFDVPIKDSPKTCRIFAMYQNPLISREDCVRVLNDIYTIAKDGNSSLPGSLGGLFGHPDNIRHIYDDYLKHPVPEWYVAKYSSSFEINKFS